MLSGGRGRTRTRLLAALVAVAAAPTAGCFPDATEVVVVVDTDLALGEFGSIGLSIANGSNSSFSQTATFISGQMQLPATIGVVPSNGVADFTVTAVLWPPGVFDGGSGPQRPPAFPGMGTPAGPIPLVTRKASHARFVSGEQRVLFLPLQRVCLCAGTSCPHALDVECRELMSPTLPSFDPDHLPRIAPAAP
jgi:hypothetical protein